jgi:hypothetical protein
LIFVSILIAILTVGDDHAIIRGCQLGLAGTIAIPIPVLIAITRTVMIAILMMGADHLVEVTGKIICLWLFCCKDYGYTAAENKHRDRKQTHGSGHYFLLFYFV